MLAPLQYILPAWHFLYQQQDLLKAAQKCRIRFYLQFDYYLHSAWIMKGLSISLINRCNCYYLCFSSYLCFVFRDDNAVNFRWAGNRKLSILWFVLIWHFSCHLICISLWTLAEASHPWTPRGLLWDRKAVIWVCKSAMTSSCLDKDCLGMENPAEGIHNKQMWNVHVHHISRATFPASNERAGALHSKEFWVKLVLWQIHRFRAGRWWARNTSNPLQPHAGPETSRTKGSSKNVRFFLFIPKRPRSVLRSAGLRTPFTTAMS